ncbi:uncharacterized protein [Euwallacea similis]|uniref:uncharacterized protein n=1 Tax=Euwallacea similis TaxID=1736056 RepID=UPI00344B4091
MAGNKNSQISLVDFVILQFFYAFHSVYNAILSIFSWQFWQKQPTQIAPSTLPHEKRHFIRLYKIEPRAEGEKPVCYMKVIEFDSSCPPEEIRRRKLSYDFQSSQQIMNYRQHQRTKSDNDLSRICRNNLRY